MSKGKTKQKFTNEFKLNVVVIEGYATGNFSQVSARHGVHMTQIAKWKQQLSLKSKNNGPILDS